MEFRLVYKGRLPAASQNDTRMEDKHRIRCKLHAQLKVLWREHPSLRSWAKFDAAEAQGARSFADLLADNCEFGSLRFLPLVTNKAGLACALDILFLRRDPPGSLIVNGGDIDNRLKVLLDSLRVPKVGELPKKWQPEASENPLYCLMEDDSLITEIKVTRACFKNRFGLRVSTYV